MNILLNLGKIKFGKIQINGIEFYKLKNKIFLRQNEIFEMKIK